MALHRVPGGNRNYLADDRGFREIGMSSDMSEMMMDVGDRIAGNARAVGESEYGTSAITLPVGVENEIRQGVSVHETKAHKNDWRDRILLRVVEAMQITRG